MERADLIGITAKIYIFKNGHALLCFLNKEQDTVIRQEFENFSAAKKAMNRIYDSWEQVQEVKIYLVKEQ